MKNELYYVKIKKNAETVFNSSKDVVTIVAKWSSATSDRKSSSFIA
jgi:hypothetical protein